MGIATTQDDAARRDQAEAADAALRTELARVRDEASALRQALERHEKAFAALQGDLAALKDNAAALALAHEAADAARAEAEANRAEAARLNQMMDALRTDHATELDRLRTELEQAASAAIEQQTERRFAETAALTRMLERLRIEHGEHASELRAKLNEAKARHAEERTELRNELMRLEVALEMRAKVSNELRLANESMRRSASWRMTVPLRKLRSMFRRGG
ncbi:MAG: hypothetical protein JJT81_19070 [Rubellimicrobium sp.]|nr:hypothetical protein [Rubellimicrobium sp.]